MPLIVDTYVEFDMSEGTDGIMRRARGHLVKQLEEVVSCWDIKLTQKSIETFGSCFKTVVRLETEFTVLFRPQYPGWRPYCLRWDTMTRMELKSFGFQCFNCWNKIDFEMRHYEEGK